MGRQTINTHWSSIGQGHICPKTAQTAAFQKSLEVPEDLD
jgi:pSer/pThr/pTyr-binding forkhead associated (FHA) protein